MTKTTLQKFRLKNFKAIKNSKTVRFGPLTVFIGNNGSGKSSLIEGLEMIQTIVERGLDEAMYGWRGFEHIWHKGVPHTLMQKSDPAYRSNPMSFELQVKTQERTIKSNTEITLGFEDQLFIHHEKLVETSYRRDREGDRAKYQKIEARAASKVKKWREIAGEPDGGSSLGFVEAGRSILQEQPFLKDWQFLMLAPQAMGAPIPQKRTGGAIRLNKDGSNIAEYLLNIREIDKIAFDGILETLQYVLPYARDLQPALTSELERAVYLQLTEKDFKVPGWLLSTGTLRVLALLALLRHPEPPSLIVIEEIENGLDPRSVHLIINEIRNAVEDGRTQVIATTHSPYLLDLLTLSHIVFVERVDGQPTFTRPDDQKSLQHWIDRFGPGKLYTMGKLSAEQRS